MSALVAVKTGFVYFERLSPWETLNTRSWSIFFVAVEHLSPGYQGEMSVATFSLRLDGTDDRSIQGLLMYETKERGGAPPEGVFDEYLGLSDPGRA